MKSSGDVRSAIAALLVADLPQRCEVMREGKGLSARELPTPGNVMNGQAPDDAFSGSSPRVLIAVTNPRHVPPMRSVDWDSGGPVYELRYACQVEVWALGASWENALTMRDEAEAAVRTSLIECANLSTDPAEATNYAVHPPTVQAQFGYPLRAPNASGRTWAPALVSVDIRTEESMLQHSTVLPPPEDQVTGVALWPVHVPLGASMPVVTTDDGLDEIRRWRYGDSGPVHEVGNAQPGGVP